MWCFASIFLGTWQSGRIRASSGRCGVPLGARVSPRTVQSAKSWFVRTPWASSLCSFLHYFCNSFQLKKHQKKERLFDPFFFRTILGANMVPKSITKKEMYGVPNLGLFGYLLRSWPQETSGRLQDPQNHQNNSKNTCFPPTTPPTWSIMDEAMHTIRGAAMTRRKASPI